MTERRCKFCGKIIDLDNWEEHIEECQFLYSLKKKVENMFKSVVLPSVEARCPNCGEYVEAEANPGLGMSWEGDASVKCWNCDKIIVIPWEIQAGVPEIKKEEE